jgi:hypothetical protein
MFRRNFGLKLDDANQSQNSSPEDDAQQYSSNCPTRSVVSTSGRFCQLCTVIAE